MKYFIGFLLLIIFSVVPVIGQNPSQTKISGLIKDQNDAVVVGARVFLLNLNTRMEKTTNTDSGGAFTFDKVVPGNYEIRVAAEGFAQQITPVQVTTAGISNLEIALTIGESQLTVTAEVGRSEQLRNIPQAVSVVTSNEILERSTSVLSQVGKEEAGLNVQTTSPTIGAVVVRGLTGKNVVNFVDGVRYTNSAQRGGINTFFNLNEPSSLQAVEVLRGPNSAQYGSDSLGGTVNLVTKTPIFGTDRNEFHGEINPFFNSADRSFGSNVLLSYGTQHFGGYVNINGRRINTLRTANGLDSHSAVTRFLGLPSSILYDRNPNTEFTQYGGAARLNYSPTDDQQLVFFYQRSQQDEGKRFDQLLGGDGNLLADLRNLMLDFGYLRYVRQNLGFFDSGSFTVSYNSQREERVNQGGQGNPFGDITHQPERTTATGFSFFLDKELPFRNSFLFGGDFYHERFRSTAFTVNPLTNVTTFSRPRIPDNARFDSGGLYIQNAWQAISDRLRITGALRYGAAFYKVRAEDSPVVSGSRLFSDDSLRFADFSGRIGAVIRIANNVRAAFNYSRGFRYPSMTDLGTLGLTGDGFEIDFLTTINLGGTIGTTADTNAVDTGLSVSKQRSEFSNNFDAGLRWSTKRFDTEFTAFRLDINDTITKQSLILPNGAVGQFLGDQPIVNQLPNGVVFVPLSTSPVLVRSNFTSAKLFGIEYELETPITKDLKFQGNFTYIRAEDKETGLPPNIEGGTPPPTAFLSLKYAPAGRKFWIEGYSNLAVRQDRLSSLDLSDRRTGAIRSRSQIANFFRRGACVRGLTNNPDGICGSGDETVLLATSETLPQVQNRVLGVGVNSAPLFNYLPSYALFNLRGGFTVNEKSKVFVAFQNIFDSFHRNPSWGIDGAGRSLFVQYRYKF
ncbi:MAG: TonB-dependent receptor [Acidobacteria bacterium]|nr:TonB-dependent receptor [Acidobacteriota bacterium]